MNFILACTKFANCSPKFSRQHQKAESRSIGFWSAAFFVLAAAAVTGCVSTDRKAVLGHGGGFYGAVAFSPDGRYLAAERRDAKAVIVFDTVTRVESARFSYPEAAKAIGLAGLAYTRDAQLVAVLAGKREITVWNASSSNLLARLPSEPGPSALSPDARILAVSPRRQPVSLWQIPGSNSFELTNCSTRIVQMTFSADGRVLATVDENHQIQLWDTTNGVAVGSLPRQEESVYSMAFAPDGSLLAVASRDVSIWQLNKGERVMIARSPSLSAGERAVGILWILASTLGAHPSGSLQVFGRAPADAVAFSPDGKYLAIVNSAADLNTALGEEKQQVRLIEVASGHEVSGVACGASVCAVAFSPDGQRVAAAGGGVDVWDWRKASHQAAAPQAYEPVVLNLDFHAPSCADSNAPLARVPAKRVRLAGFVDARTNSALGERRSAFNVKMSDVLPSLPVADGVRDAIAQLFSCCGHTVVDHSPDWEISGTVKQCLIETPASLVQWKVNADLEIELQVQEARDATTRSATYTGQARLKTVGWLGDAIIQRAFNEALQGLLDKIQSDPAWNQLPEASNAQADSRFRQ